MTELSKWELESLATSVVNELLECVGRFDIRNTAAGKDLDREQVKIVENIINNS